MVKLTKKQIALYQAWFDLDYKIASKRHIDTDSKEKVEMLILAREKARADAIKEGVPGIK